MYKVMNVKVWNIRIRKDLEEEEEEREKKSACICLTDVRKGSHLW